MSEKNPTHPQNRLELQKELGVSRDSLIWMRKQFSTYLEDCGHMGRGHPLEPYLVWLFRKFGQPPFLLQGKKEGRYKINRRLIEIELQERPEKYTKDNFWEVTEAETSDR